MLRRQLWRAQVVGFCAKRDLCLIGLAAGATLHDWVRKLQVLGHDVRLIPPIHVKPHGKRMGTARRMTQPLPRPCVKLCKGQ